MTYEDLTPADKCLVHRYLYYCLARPLLQDHEYDMLERDGIRWLEEMADAFGVDPEMPPWHPLLQPGSDLESSYTPETIALAAGLLRNPAAARNESRFEKPFYTAPETGYVSVLSPEGHSTTPNKTTKATDMKMKLTPELLNAAFYAALAAFVAALLGAESPQAKQFVKDTDDDDEDEKPKKKAKPPVDDDDDEDEKPAKKAKPPVDDEDDETAKKLKRRAERKARRAAEEAAAAEAAKKGKKAPVDDDDDDDEDEKPKKKAKPPVDDDDDEDEKPAKKAKPPVDDDDDEDEVTAEKLRALGLKLIKAGKADQLRDALSRFKVEKLSELPEKSFAKAWTALSKL